MTAGCTRKRILLIESETKKLFLQEALFTTTMSKARVPKRKEEYVPPDEINEFREEILEAGRHLAVVNRPRFPDAEKVSEAIGNVLTVVENYKLLGMWVTSRVSNSITKYATTKKNPRGEFVHVFFINQCNAQFLTIGFSSDYSTGRYRLRCKIEHVFRDRSIVLDGGKKSRFQAPVTS